MTLSNLINLRDALLLHAKQIGDLVAEAGAGGGLNEEQQERAVATSLHVAESIVKNATASIHIVDAAVTGIADRDRALEDFSLHLALLVKNEAEVSDAPRPPGPSADSTVKQGEKTPTVAQSDSAPSKSHAEQTEAVPAAQASVAEKIAVSTADTPQGNGKTSE